MEPKTNNGTLRLPLKPIGLHSEKPSSALVEDPLSEGSSEFKEGDLSSEGGDVGAAVNESTSVDEQETKEELDDFWSYMEAKMKAAMEWAHGVVQSLSGSENPTTRETMLE